ncbi:MAG: DNA translocase FtsK 4TM domain-containing protein [Candidatus Jacksonbacteria bacterium]|nr:DNA translocase FtsK 4TM domain-containing protein [Candidatus Jacksonbacteria bacterium]
MAKRKRPKYDNEDEDSGFIHKDVERAIWVVVFAALSLVLLLSLVEKGGTLGSYISKAAFILFGYGAWVFPAILLFVALFLIGNQDSRVRTLKIAATIVFVFVYSAMLNLKIPIAEVFSYLNDGRGGGYAGLIFGYPLLKLTSYLVTVIALVALGTIAVLMMFGTKVFSVGRAVVWIIAKLPFGGVLSGVKTTLADKLKREPEFVPDIEAESPKTELTAPKEKSQQTDRQSFTKSIVPKNQKNEEFDQTLKARFRRKIDIPLTLLEKRDGIPSSGDIAANKEKIRKALENFGIMVEMGNTSTGPTVTQYTLKPSEGVKLSAITALHNDLALALAAHPIRIEAPIPGKSVVGIEVPNSVIATVGLREILQSEQFRSRQSNLTLALGKDVSGVSYVADLERMPHLLIAGATGSGKSVAINVLITSLIYQNSPDDLKFILIDPKRVELTAYNNTPHLMTPVITEVKKTINALKWSVSEMDRRFDILSGAGARNIEKYNQGNASRMPYIVIVIDELADLMSVAAREVEALIVRLAQMSRAVGIHLVLATQRPSVNVITGLIKANITARIAFTVASQTDSRTILDSSGAEKLLGRGDMLFITADLSKPKRLQGAYIDDKEIKAVVSFLKEQAEPDYLAEVTEKNEGALFHGASGLFGDEEGDEFLDEARELVIRAGKASASYLQRHLRIGYARAARILDLLEAEGVIGPGDGAKPREVLGRVDDGEDGGGEGEI